MDYILRLPAKWKELMPRGDQQRIGKAIFRSKHQIGDDAARKLWWYSLEYGASTITQPQPETYVCCGDSSCGCLKRHGLLTLNAHNVAPEGLYSKE